MTDRYHLTEAQRRCSCHVFYGTSRCEVCGAYQADVHEFWRELREQAERATTVPPAVEQMEDT